jgi:hypothetical protein
MNMIQPLLEYDLVDSDSPNTDLVQIGHGKGVILYHDEQILRTVSWSKDFIVDGQSHGPGFVVFLHSRTTKVHDDNIILEGLDGCQHYSNRRVQMLGFYADRGAKLRSSTLMSIVIKFRNRPNFHKNRIAKFLD